MKIRFFDFVSKLFHRHDFILIGKERSVELCNGKEVERYTYRCKDKKCKKIKHEVLPFKGNEKDIVNFLWYYVSIAKGEQREKPKTNSKPAEDRITFDFTNKCVYIDGKKITKKILIDNKLLYIFPQLIPMDESRDISMADNAKKIQWHMKRTNGNSRIFMNNEDFLEFYDTLKQD